MEEVLYNIVRCCGRGQVKIIPCALRILEYVSVVRAIRRESLSRVKEVSGKRSCTGRVRRVVVVCNNEDAGGIS